MKRPRVATGGRSRRPSGPRTSSMSRRAKSSAGSKRVWTPVGTRAGRRPATKASKISTAITSHVNATWWGMPKTPTVLKTGGSRASMDVPSGGARRPQPLGHDDRGQREQRDEEAGQPEPALRGGHAEDQGHHAEAGPGGAQPQEPARGAPGRGRRPVHDALGRPGQPEEVPDRDGPADQDAGRLGRSAQREA